MRLLVPSFLASLNRTAWIPAITGAVSLLLLASGLGLGYPYLTGAGVMGLACVLVGSIQIALGHRRAAQAPAAPPSAPRLPFPPTPRPPVDPNDLNAVVQQMLAQGRYALLLRPQIARNLDERRFQQTLAQLQDGMALVPDGEVVLGQLDDALEDGKLSEDQILARRGRVVQVDRFFLDRYPVTNAEYYEFVSAGGYEQVALWDQTIWPAVLDMVDQSGQPGPRYWYNGCYHPDKADHPVVGVSWYEAQAYARWVGKRLPSDAEWVKAGSWPVKVSATTRLQRKYPWGETMDRTRANLWASSRKDTVPVRQYSEGVSVGGVYQLIGNVWEWTRGSFASTNPGSDELLVEDSMKSIRGGAFDTYFDNQATCQFQSGEYPLSRRVNIGFRCAVGVCDLALARAPQIDPAASEAAPEEITV